MVLFSFMNVVSKCVHLNTLSERTE